MREHALQEIDLDSLDKVTGGESYTQACATGAVAGARAGSGFGPWGTLAGAAGGCALGMGIKYATSGSGGGGE
jgi:hypothetical protein